MKIAIIDNAVISYSAWHVMHSANYQAETGIELIEFARNYAKSLIFLNTLIRPDRTYLALDCPREKVWRHSVFAEYYREHPEHAATYTIASNPAGIYLSVEDKTYLLTFTEDTQRWVSRKLRKIEVPQPEVHQPLIIDDNHTAAATVRSLIPGYKRDRATSAWAYETPKTEFKDRSLVLARNAAHLISGVAVEQLATEADDIAAAVAVSFPDDEIIAVSTDSDWSQLGLMHPKVRWYNPTTHEYVDRTKAECARAMWIKVIGGDSGDGIPGIRMKESPTLIGETKAARMMDAVGVADIYPWLKANAYGPALERNIRLIFARRSPVWDTLVERIPTLRPSALKYKWADFGLTDAAISLVVADAERQRATAALQGGAK